MIVDYQNDFASSQGKVARSLGAEALKSCQRIAPRIQELIDEWHAKGQPIFFITSDYSGKHYTGVFKKFRSSGPYADCAAVGTWGHDLFEITKSDDDCVVLKHFFDAFYKTNLEQALKDHNVSRVNICGINTDICVFQTAFAAAVRGYSVEIYADATDTVTPHKKPFLDNLALVAGIKIL